MLFALQHRPLYLVFIENQESPMTIIHQRTLQHPVTCIGVGLHSGDNVKLSLKPAAADTGIVFVRTDVDAEIADVPARYDMVTETKLGTTLTNEHGTKACTVEHLMAALWGCGIDNARIELDGPEVPIMDGSSEPFVFLIECAGTVVQNAPRVAIEILRDIEVTDGDSTVLLQPSNGLTLDISIAFDHDSIGKQRDTYDFTRTNFKQALCRARTFGFAQDVEKLRAMGLARGGSLDNAVVLNESEIMNPEGLRYDDEFVRHKALDCVGDYFLACGHIQGHIRTHRPGHCINNALLHALFSDPANYRIVPMVKEAISDVTLEDLPQVAYA